MFTHQDAAGPLLRPRYNMFQLFWGPEVASCRTERCRSYLAVLCSSAHLHGQTCRWQMASREIRGERSPLAELTLKVAGRLGSWSEPTLLLRERGLNILPTGAEEIQLQPNEEWADLPAPSPPPIPSPPALSLFNVARQVSSSQTSVFPVLTLLDRNSSMSVRLLINSALLTIYLSKRWIFPHVSWNLTQISKHTRYTHILQTTVDHRFLLLKL